MSLNTLHSRMLFSPRTFLEKLHEELDAATYLEKISYVKLAHFYNKFLSFFKTCVKPVSEQIKILAQCSLKYIDCIRSYIDGTSTLTRKQLENIQKCIQIVGDIPKLEGVRNEYIKWITVPLLEKITATQVNLWFGKEVFKNFNVAMHCVSRELRNQLAAESRMYLCKMVDILCTCGDFDYQVTLVETIFRMCSDSQISEYAYNLFPESKTLADGIRSIKRDHFDKDLRVFLNNVNSKFRKVLSVKCDKVLLGDICVGAPKDPESDEHWLWVDFNLVSQTITILCDRDSLRTLPDFNDSSEDNGWESLIINASDVSSVVSSLLLPENSAFPQGSILLFNLTAPCMVLYPSSAKAAQKKQLRMAILNCPEFEQLEAEVLPNMFDGKLYNLNSSQEELESSAVKQQSAETIRSSVKRTYKPLKTKVSISRTRLRTDTESSSVSDAMSLKYRMFEAESEPFQESIVPPVCQSPKIKDIDQLKEMAADPKFSRLTKLQNNPEKKSDDALLQQCLKSSDNASVVKASTEIHSTSPSLSAETKSPISVLSQSLEQTENEFRGSESVATSETADRVLPTLKSDSNLSSPSYFSVFNDSVVEVSANNMPKGNDSIETYSLQNLLQETAEENDNEYSMVSDQCNKKLSSKQAKTKAEKKNIIRVKWRIPERYTLKLKNTVKTAVETEPLTVKKSKNPKQELKPRYSASKHHVVKSKEWGKKSIGLVAKPLQANESETSVTAALVLEPAESGTCTVVSDDASQQQCIFSQSPTVQEVLEIDPDWSVKPDEINQHASTQSECQASENAQLAEGFAVLKEPHKNGKDMLTQDKEKSYDDLLISLLNSIENEDYTLSSRNETVETSEKNSVLNNGKQQQEITVDVPEFETPNVNNLSNSQSIFEDDMEPVSIETESKQSESLQVQNNGSVMSRMANETNENLLATKISEKKTEDTLLNQMDVAEEEQCEFVLSINDELSKIGGKENLESTETIKATRTNRASDCKSPKQDQLCKNILSKGIDEESVVEINKEEKQLEVLKDVSSKYINENEPPILHEVVKNGNMLEKILNDEEMHNNQIKETERDGLNVTAKICLKQNKSAKNNKKSKKGKQKQNRKNNDHVESAVSKASQQLKQNKFSEISEEAAAETENNVDNLGDTPDKSQHLKINDSFENGKYKQADEKKRKHNQTQSTDEIPSENKYELMKEPKSQKESNQINDNTKKNEEELEEEVLEEKDKSLKARKLSKNSKTLKKKNHEGKSKERKDTETKSVEEINKSSQHLHQFESNKNDKSLKINRQHMNNPHENNGYSAQASGDLSNVDNIFNKENEDPKNSGLIKDDENPEQRMRTRKNQKRYSKQNPSKVKNGNLHLELHNQKTETTTKVDKSTSNSDGDMKPVSPKFKTDANKNSEVESKESNIENACALDPDLKLASSESELIKSVSEEPPLKKCRLDTDDRDTTSNNRSKVPISTHQGEQQTQKSKKCGRKLFNPNDISYFTATGIYISPNANNSCNLSVLSDECNPNNMAVEEGEQTNAILEHRNNTISTIVDDQNMDKLFDGLLQEYKNNIQISDTYKDTLTKNRKSGNYKTCHNEDITGNSEGVEENLNCRWMQNEGRLTNTEVMQENGKSELTNSNNVPKHQKNKQLKDIIETSNFSEAEQNRESKHTHNEVICEKTELAISADVPCIVSLNGEPQLPCSEQSKQLSENTSSSKKSVYISSAGANTNSSLNVNDIENQVTVKQNGNKFGKTHTVCKKRSNVDYEVKGTYKKQKTIKKPSTTSEEVHVMNKDDFIDVTPKAVQEQCLPKKGNKSRKPQTVSRRQSANEQQQNADSKVKEAHKKQITVENLLVTHETANFSNTADVSHLIPEAIQEQSTPMEENESHEKQTNPAQRSLNADDKVKKTHKKQIVLEKLIITHETAEFSNTPDVIHSIPEAVQEQSTPMKENELDEKQISPTQRPLNAEDKIEKTHKKQAVFEKPLVAQETVDVIHLMPKAIQEQSTSVEENDLGEKQTSSTQRPLNAEDKIKKTHKKQIVLEKLLVTHEAVDIIHLIPNANQEQSTPVEENDIGEKQTSLTQRPLNADDKIEKTHKKQIVLEKPLVTHEAVDVIHLIPEAVQEQIASAEENDLSEKRTSPTKRPLNADDKIKKTHQKQKILKKPLIMNVKVKASNRSTFVDLMSEDPQQQSAQKITFEEYMLNAVNKGKQASTKKSKRRSMGTRNDPVKKKKQRRRRVAGEEVQLHSGPDEPNNYLISSKHSKLRTCIRDLQNPTFLERKRKFDYLMDSLSEIFKKCDSDTGVTQQLSKSALKTPVASGRPLGESKINVKTGHPKKSKKNLRTMETIRKSPNEINKECIQNFHSDSHLDTEGQVINTSTLAQHEEYVGSMTDNHHPVLPLETFAQTEHSNGQIVNWTEAGSTNGAAALIKCIVDMILRQQREISEMLLQNLAPFTSDPDVNMYNALLTEVNNTLQTYFRKH